MRDFRDMEAEAKRIANMTPDERKAHDQRLKQHQHMLDVVYEIEAERARQVDAEGWTPEHDDEHDAGEMAFAAGCYAIGAAKDETARGVMLMGGMPPLAGWPWDFKWWKPKDRRRDLVRAAALIIAEIERLDRAAKSQGPSQ